MTKGLQYPCSWPRCPNYAVRKGRCAEHQRAVERERGTAHARGYNNAAWRKLRKMILARDPLCVKCLAEGRVTPSREIDHIIPKPLGRDAMDNLQGLCKPHHSRKTRAENNPPTNP